MATSPQVPNTPSFVAVKSSIASILLFMLLGAIIASVGFGGVLYHFASSGRISIRRNAVSKSELPAVPSTHLMVLDPLLVNLEDGSRNSYLRLGMTLQVMGAEEKNNHQKKDEKNEDETVAAIRDTALTVLGKQTASSLLASDGKGKLKAELKNALAEHNGDLSVTALYFTDFLVQQ
jgi:flagellar FliL protein